MTNYNPKDFTYGVELEYADVKFGTPLPEGCAWNMKDNTIVNSTGIANDPQGKLWEFGGEINTRPTNTVQEQVEVVAQINQALEDSGYPPVINYRCNLHVHVRVPGLSKDLESCKKLLQYVMDYGKEAFNIIERIPVPKKGTMSEEAYLGALKRMKRRHKSHQYELPKSRTDAMMAATTVQEFYEEHAPKTEKGRMWFFSPRAAINLRQMWEETETIEFRHFPGTIDLVEMESCVRWCREFLVAALCNELTPREFYLTDPKPWKFPEFAEYDHELEKMYQLTNHDSNSRAVIAKRIEEFRNTGKIIVP